jgi:DNA transformation protein and related proteins
MSYNPSFADELLGLMQGVGKITTRKMFGALGFYHGSALFACLMDGDIFYLKAKGVLAEELKEAGSKLFTYNGKSGKQVAMPYWTAPLVCLDDPDEMTKWCKKAIVSLADIPAPKKPKKKG